jgi:BirA family transcriptional regulator, biotin operon repressor / biotin---[acetyl-CoA-carboxylase] ligase
LGSTFDRMRFASRLTTRRLGRALIARASVGSTNDEAWAAFAADAPDGTVVVADTQTAGRGRHGRVWHTAPGLSLALSVLLRQGCEPPALGLLPLVAGLAVAEALEGLGARPALKWPNDVLLEGRKVAGVLCETRRAGPATRGSFGPGAGRAAAVVGTGVNLGQTGADFPEEISATATSLALVGVTASREDVAAAFLDMLEVRWDELQHAGPAAPIEAWRARAAFWDRPVTVRVPGGEVSGVARGLDAEGALLLTLADGTESTVRAGDLDLGPAEERG